MSRVFRLFPSREEMAEEIAADTTEISEESSELFRMPQYVFFLPRTVGVVAGE